MVGAVLWALAVYVEHRIELGVDGWGDYDFTGVG